MRSFTRLAYSTEPHPPLITQTDMYGNELVTANSLWTTGYGKPLPSLLFRRIFVHALSRLLVAFADLAHPSPRSKSSDRSPS